MGESCLEYRFNHNNLNVLDLEKSIKFYEDALGLFEDKRLVDEKSEYIIVYLSDGFSSHLLELTWIRSRKEKYKLGDNEIHLAFTVDDFKSSLKKHRQMQCVCFENPKMGIYFISDPDGYWIEIMPQK